MGDYALLTPTSEAKGGYTKSLQRLDTHFSPQNYHNDHFMIDGDHKINWLSRCPWLKKQGCKIIGTERATKWPLKKIYAQIFEKHFWISEFLNFDDDLLPLNRFSGKKSHSKTIALKKQKCCTSNFFSFSNFCYTLFSYIVIVNTHTFVNTLWSGK